MSRIASFHATPVATWPKVDKAAWNVALAPQDLLDPTIGYALRWKASTRALNQTGYGYWLDWLKRSGLLDANSSPGSRANRASIAAYRKAMLDAGLAPYTVAGRLQQLTCVLRAIAPEQDWAWMHKGASRLHSKAEPVRDKLASMEPAENVMQLALDLMHAAEHDRFRTSVERAVLYRDGLIIALLTSRPYRRANIAAIELDRHLQHNGDGLRLIFDRSETKGGRQLSSQVPNDLVESFDRYIKIHRAVLLQCRRSEGPVPNGLWISKQGTQMTASAIAVQVKSRTIETFGRAIIPQRFRQIYATDTATVTPADADCIQHGLGHASKRTSEKYYNLAQAVEAGSRYQATIASIRREGKKTLKRERGSKSDAGDDRGN